MKISKIVTMKNLDTGENKKVKIGTKEIREFNFPKKDYIINKVFIDNTWLKIAVLVWVSVLSILLVLAKNSENYGFLAILIFTGLMTITLAVNFPIARLYFFGEGILNIKKRLIANWVWVYNKKAESHKNCTEVEKRDCSFEKRAFEEINKIAIRFYLSHIIIALTLLFMVTFLTVEIQSADKSSLIFIAEAWLLTEFYLWAIRCFIRTKARMRYNVTTRVNYGNGNTVLKFSLNGNYAIEEEISLIFKDCAF